MGQTLGRPVIVKTDNDGYVVLLTSGYNSTADGKGRLWMLNADTGAVIKEFTVDAGALGAEAGLAHVTAFGESTGTVQYVYGGDLLGNVWRFDLKGKGDPTKVATLIGADGLPQPVTAAPELLYHSGQRVIFVGTGRLMDISDFGNSRVQTIYAIADGATLVNARNTLVKQTYDRATDTMSNNPVDWSLKRGWYIDLPAGEQINTRPTIAYGGLAFVSNINGGSDCSASSYLYVVNALDGKKFVGTNFVSTLVSKTSNSSGVTALLTTGQKIVGAGQDADGKPWEREITSGIPHPPRQKRLDRDPAVGTGAPGHVHCLNTPGSTMKAVTQATISLLALGILLSGAASSYATDIAELPLKASVLAKPNVIFGLDDSGSMDSELMLNTNDGAFWWDYSAKSGWDGNGKPWFNAVGDASATWRKMVYLFPNGNAAGARVYNDARQRPLRHSARPRSSPFCVRATTTRCTTTPR